MDGTSGCFPWLRLPESLALTEKKPELAFVRIFCANALGWKYDRAGQFKEAIPYFEMALSLSSPDVDEDAVQEDAKAGLQEAREEVAASGSWTTALRRS
jgi:tetratricopeptide (TPR) repeat protein